MKCVKPLLRACLNLGLALTLVVAGVAFTTAGAQAQNWGVAPPAPKKTEAEIEEAEAKERAAAREKAAAEEQAEAEAKEAEAANAPPESTPAPVAAAPEPEPAPVAVAKKATRKPVVDLEVPGCAPGMLCTVCVAGCGGQSARIVHAERKVSRPE